MTQPKIETPPANWRPDVARPGEVLAAPTLEMQLLELEIKVLEEAERKRASK